MATSCKVFHACVQAIRDGTLIERKDRRDKEFHFQDWFQRCLESVGLSFETPGRNVFPDFRIVGSAEGYEVKGLAYPGREASYDSNSQVPCGQRGERQLYYVFGRYPALPDGDHYPVLDLVFCHGSFLNADDRYEHRNRSFGGFGCYGDIRIRDRKMYVAPTPFALTDGVAHHRTLILPQGQAADGSLIEVGRLTRREADRILVGYDFDLRTNELVTRTVRNPTAGQVHVFIAYRAAGDPRSPVTMRASDA